MIGFLISLFFVGVIAGYLARLFVPGDDPMSFWMTLAIGVIGSYVGGLIGWAIFDRDDAFSPGGLISSIIGAVVVLLIYNAVGGRRRTSRA
jgi:uncharacterized membrane protein YeaQ/YmgE (transglycosylase-associated protein family)